MFGARLVSLFLISTFQLTYSIAAAPKPGPFFEIHGHRGARATRPENSLPAFQHALESGATALEMDLGITKDGHVVINHDLSVDTDLCVSRDLKLASLEKPLLQNLTLKQVKTYDCGSIRNPLFPSQLLFPGTKILTFRELIRFLNKSPLPQAKKVSINIETKTEDSGQRIALSAERFVEAIAEVIFSENFDASRVILQSFDFRTITYAKRKWPSLKTSALVDNLDKNRLHQDLDRVFTTTRADYISPDGGLCSKELVAYSHSRGKKVLVWTINKKFHWRHFVKMGVDGIITDDPASLAQYLKLKVF